jgi:Tfp pilus assembly protein PilV
VADAARRHADVGEVMMTRLSSERGTTLIETMIAVGMLLVVMAGLLSMASLATNYTENHGHLEARTTEYAQDKMEQLLALAYGDTTSNTVLDTANLVTQLTGGSGLGAATINASAVSGGSNTAAPITLYVDWLANDGTPLGGGTAAPENWFYERVWEIKCVSAVACTSNPVAGLKQITVTATVRSSVGRALIPKSTVVALKAAEF